MEPECDMTATDVFLFDVQAARVTYLLNKKRRGEKVTRMPQIPADRNAAFDDAELPGLLRNQAE